MEIKIPNTITITVDCGLSERAGRINPKTYQAIKESKGSSAFYPAVNFDSVLNDLSNREGIYFKLDASLEENKMIVSSDVKKLYYKNTEILTF